jgi:protein Mpv17
MTTLSLARVYKHSFHAYPNWTLAITGGCLSAAGDVVAQLAQNAMGGKDREDRPLFDWERTTRFFCYGLAMSPIMGRWNIFLERRFPSCSAQMGKLSIKSLSKRVAADQLIMAPLGLGLFISAMGLMEGRSPRQVEERFQDLYGPLLLANWKVWPLAQLVNFRYMPLPYRVPFSQTVGVFWTLYLSIVNSEEDRHQDRAAALPKSST